MLGLMGWLNDEGGVDEDFQSFGFPDCCWVFGVGRLPGGRSVPAVRGLIPIERRGLSRTHRRNSIPDRNQSAPAGDEFNPRDLEALRRHSMAGALRLSRACTPRVVAVAKDLKYRVMLLAIWISSPPGDRRRRRTGRQHEQDFNLGVLVGNEELRSSGTKRKTWRLRPPGSEPSCEVGADWDERTSWVSDKFIRELATFWRPTFTRVRPE